MRAFHAPAAGEQPQLSDLPVPEVTNGHVLVRVRAAGLNTIDNGIAAGMLAGMLPLEQASEGLATIAGGKARGKIVVKVGD